MKKIISYKFKLNRLKTHIEKRLEFEARICRDVWNEFVSYNIQRLSSGETAVTGSKFYTVYKNIKKENPKYSYWKDGISTAVNMELYKNKDRFNKFIVLKSGDPDKLKLRDLSKYSLSKSAYKRSKNIPNYQVKLTDYKDFPQFHSYKTHCAFSLDTSGFTGFDRDNGRIKISKIGWISFKKHRRIEGEPKNITISKKNNKWYISIQTELEIENPIHSSKKMVGLDRGVTNFVATSDGEFYDSMNFLKKSQDKLTFLQRRLAKKEKNSNRYKKIQQRISKLHDHISNSRINYIHHVSKDITDKYSYIVMEDLDVKKMTKSNKGNSQEHGKNVKEKSKLNQAILDQGWGFLKQQIKYKSEWKGGYLDFVKPEYTSQKCSICGYISSNNRTTQASFVCQKCGHTENADINSAKNILADGIAVTAQGGTQITEPMNCETEVSRVQEKAKEDILLETAIKEPQLVTCN